MKDQAIKKQQANNKRQINNNERKRNIPNSFGHLKIEN
jgi:hypothetical protein